MDKGGGQLGLLKASLSFSVKVAAAMNVCARRTLCETGAETAWQGIGESGAQTSEREWTGPQWTDARVCTGHEV